jgi:hypothetical protein
MRAIGEGEGELSLRGRAERGRGLRSTSSDGGAVRGYDMEYESGNFGMESRGRFEVWSVSMLFSFWGKEEAANIFVIGQNLFAGFPGESETELRCN